MNAPVQLDLDFTTPDGRPPGAAAALVATAPPVPAGECRRCGHPEYAHWLLLNGARAECADDGGLCGCLYFDPGPRVEVGAPLRDGGVSYELAIRGERQWALIVYAERHADWLGVAGASATLTDWCWKSLPLRWNGSALTPDARWRETRYEMLNGRGKRGEELVKALEAAERSIREGRIPWPPEAAAKGTGCAAPSEEG